jgi:hypothetical protein
MHEFLWSFVITSFSCFPSFPSFASVKGLFDFLYIQQLDLTVHLSEIESFRNRGRTGFDFVNTPEAACRGWFVGLVKNRTKK